MTTPKIKVLIVEDEMIFARQLSSWLKDKASDIFTSTNSESGSVYVSRERPDIVFIDNQLPGINGIEIIKLYKEKSPSSILILMSSVFRLEEIPLALKKGADYVMNKRNETAYGINSIVEAAIESKLTGSPFWKLVQFDVLKKSTASKQIVILEDDELFAFQLSIILNNLPSQIKHTILRFTKTTQLIQHCEKNGVPDILFLEYFLINETGAEALNYINNQAKSSKTIILSAKIDIDTALTLNLEGVSEFILEDNHWQESVRECASRLDL